MKRIIYNKLLLIGRKKSQETFKQIEYILRRHSAHMISTHKGPNLYLAMRYSIETTENGTLSYIGERANKQTNKQTKQQQQQQKIDLRKD